MCLALNAQLPGVVRYAPSLLDSVSTTSWGRSLSHALLRPLASQFLAGMYSLLLTLHLRVSFVPAAQHPRRLFGSAEG
jgi:hypothetical protein